MKPCLFLLLASLFAGCGQPALPGVYHTVGSEDQFLMTLEVRADGQAKLSTRAKLGQPGLDQAVQASMSFDQGRWVEQGNVVVVTGTRTSGSPITFRFERQKNGELRWDKNGARFVRRS